jgi:hypothetical protein
MAVYLQKRQTIPGVGGGPEEISAIVYTESNNQLPIADVISILKQPDMDKVSNIPPQHPKGGQVVLISDGKGMLETLSMSGCLRIEMTSAIGS